MRPPPEGGGNPKTEEVNKMNELASMRPPPEGGGNDLLVSLPLPSLIGFNEAATRRRRKSFPSASSHYNPDNV